VLVAIAPLLATPVWAKSLAGAPCSKLNITTKVSNQNFICTKKGKKLSWAQKQQTARATPEESHRYPEALQIQKILDTANASARTNTPQFDFLFQNPPPAPVSLSTTTQQAEPSNFYWTKKGLIEAADFYSRLGLPTSNGNILVFQDLDWANKELSSFGCPTNETKAGGWFVGEWNCPDHRARIFAIDWRAEGGISILGIEFQNILAHEYFHQIQMSLLSNQHNAIPFWMIEGGAQFFSSIAFSSWNKQNSYEVWLDELIHFQYLGYNQCLNVDYSKVTRGIWEESRCAYSKGAKVVEKLIANYGVNAYVEILKLSRLQSFESAFQEATGKSLADFYAETEIFLKQQKWSS
jgi:hypothetical protein